jgi:hypothetical protein
MPNVEKISALVTTFKLYSDGYAESCRAQHSKVTFDAPSLASLEAMDWYELVQNWELVDFLVAGAAKANLLVRSLESVLRWYEHSDIEEVLEKHADEQLINVD